VHFPPGASVVPEHVSPVSTKLLGFVPAMEVEAIGMLALVVLNTVMVCPGEPVARILPVEPKRRVRSLRTFLESQPMQTVPSETILAEEREDRC